MFDYARKMQLAASDLGRRAGMRAAAAVAALIAAVFLLMALWTFLARTLEWGPLAASLIIGLLFLAAAAIVWMMSNRVKHPVPSTDELKREVEARVSLATEAALDRAKEKAREVVDIAGNKASALMDEASYKAAAFVDDTEAKVQHFAHSTVGNAARSVGLSPAFFSQAQQTADRVVSQTQETVEQVKSSRAAPAAGILGAFAVGVTLARAIAGHRRDDWAEDEWEDDWDEGGDWDRRV